MLEQRHLRRAVRQPSAFGPEAAHRPEASVHQEAFHREARVNPIALLLEHDPVRPAQGAPQLVQGDVEVVLALGGRDVGSQREPDLVARASSRVTNEIEQ